MILFDLTLLRSFMYFLMMFKLKIVAILLVVISSLLLSEQIKLTKISDLTLFKSLLTLDIWTFAFAITLSTLFDLIGTIICFLDRLLVVILSFGLAF